MLGRIFGFKQGKLSMSQLKICYMLSTTEGGTWALEQLRELRSRYQYQVFAVLNGETGTLVDRFKAENIPVFVADFDFLNPRDILHLPGKVIKLARLLRQERFDVVQTHLFPAMVIGRVAAWLADVPVRLSMIAGPFHLEAKTPRWLDKATGWMDTAIIPSCEYSRQLYLKMGVSEDRLHVVYYGPDENNFDPNKSISTDLRKEYNWPSNTPIIALIAYFYPVLGTNNWTPPILHGKAIKGHDDFIRAASIVLKEFPQAKFLLIGKGWGDGGELVLQDMRALVKELGLKDSVIFTGYRSNIPAIYQDVDISVQASLNENLGGTIEALLMECPTVVTRVGGLVDTVIDGKTGVQVNVCDSEDLAKGLLSLLRAPQTAKKMGQAGRKRMLERFTLKSTVNDLHLLFEKYIPVTPRYRLSKTIGRFFFLCIFGSYVSIRFFLYDLCFFYALKRLNRLKNYVYSLFSSSERLKKFSIR